MQTDELKCRTLVVKIASRCNLNCTYCYMYNLGDETYRSQPKVMSYEIVDAMIFRSREHCEKTNMKEFTFVLHGGEPLLAGKDFFTYFVNKAREVLMPDIKPNFIVQTNGLLLSDSWCELFGSLNISFGISLDGLKADNDQYRIDHSGKGSYDRIIKGLRIAQESTHLKNKPGLLSVININADPVETYYHFKSLKAKVVDYLLPEATFDNPPMQPSADKAWAGEAPYGDWLIKMFDCWFEDEEDRYNIRQFYFIVHSILGGNFSADNLGQLNNEVLVIETNGDIEAVDGLKVCGHGFTKAGANVQTYSFSDAMQTKLARLYHLSHMLLPRKCMSCPVQEVCGGGTIPHRYSKDKGFNNPSVYCKDLMKLITHIQTRVISQLPEEIRLNSNIEALSYEQAIKITEEQFLITPEPEYADDLLFTGK